MDDLIDDLRTWSNVSNNGGLMTKAADRIAELEGKVDRLKVLEALVRELVEDYTITDKRVRAALQETPE